MTLWVWANDLSEAIRSLSECCTKYSTREAALESKPLWKARNLRLFEIRVQEAK